MKKAQIRKILCLPMSLLCFSLLAVGVRADNIKRGCSAQYYGQVLGITFNVNGRERKLGVPYQSIPIGFIDKEIKSEAGCGQLVPNRCRERARERLVACAKAQVQSLSKVPKECLSNSLTAYPIQDLYALVTAKACSGLMTRDGIRITDLLAKPYKLDVLVGIDVRGDDDCGLEESRTVVVDGQNYKTEGNKLFLQEPVKQLTITCQ
jgi:hypothetical protein